MSSFGRTVFLILGGLVGAELGIAVAAKVLEVARETAAARRARRAIHLHSVPYPESSDQSKDPS